MVLCDVMSKSFGDLVRLTRLEKGWSQRELARRIGKSPTYIHYVERGENPSAKRTELQVGKDAVDDLSRVLGIPLNDARLAAGYAPTVPEETHDILDGVVLMFQDAHKLTPEQKDRLMETVRLVARGILSESP